MDEFKTVFASCSNTGAKFLCFIIVHSSFFSYVNCILIDMPSLYIKKLNNANIFSSIRGGHIFGSLRGSKRKFFYKKARIS